MRGLLDRRRFMALALALAIISSLSLGSATGLAVADVDVIRNGSFEGGFVMVPGCGMVGAGWGCFTNGGNAGYGFYDDQWQPVVADGGHSQLIEINTKQFAASESDRFAGIYQAVTLAKGATYTLRLQGGMREHQPDSTEDKYRYRVQWGYTTDASTDWTKVANWVELPWDKIDERTAPTGLESFTTSFTAPSGKITLFIRAWKKWGNAYKELDVNIDAVSLTGKMVKSAVQPAGRVVVLPGAVIDKDATPGVVAQPVITCSGPNLLANGDFEAGFAANGVAKHWAAFNNDGAAAYGFYDEMWPPVVRDGVHGQLIEINTWGLAASDADRIAGIYQVVSGLTKGKTYEISAWGMLREERPHPDEDMYRYRVQWGYAAAGAGAGEAAITNWTELPWDDIHVRTAPGSLSSFSARFTAPSGKVVIAFRAWKKWGTAQRELDVNLDAIKLASCVSTSKPVPPAPPAPVPPAPGGVCHHVIQHGDTLAAIAEKYGTTADQIAGANGIRNHNILFLDQRLVVPCAGTTPPPAADACRWHTVQSGDTLIGLAGYFGSTVQAIAERNSLRNVNLIYVGQRLCIP